MAGGAHVQSVQRAVALVEAASSRPQGLALVELAAAVGLKATTARNLARTLVAEGVIETAGRPPRYRLGPRVHGWSARERSRRLQEGAESALLALARAFPGATVTWAERVGGEVAAVLRCDGDRPDRVERPMGRVFNPYGSASALVFQAFGAAEERMAYRAAHGFSEFGSHQWKGGQRALDRFLGRSARAGCVALPSRGGVAPVAVPVFGAGGELLAALGLALRGTPAAVRRDAPRAAARLKAAAAALGRGPAQACGGDRQERRRRC